MAHTQAAEFRERDSVQSVQAPISGDRRLVSISEQPEPGEVGALPFVPAVAEQRIDRGCQRSPLPHAGEGRQRQSQPGTAGQGAPSVQIPFQRVITGMPDGQNDAREIVKGLAGGGWGGCPEFQRPGRHGGVGGQDRRVGRGLPCKGRVGTGRCR